MWSEGLVCWPELWNAVAVSFSMQVGGAGQLVCECECVRGGCADVAVAADIMPACKIPSLFACAVIAKLPTIATPTELTHVTHPHLTHVTTEHQEEVPSGADPHQPADHSTGRTGP